MCKSLSEGGVRCADHDQYGKLIRNTQARKQYHQRKGDTAAAQRALQEVEKLQALKRAFLEDNGAVMPYTMNLTPATVQVLNQLEADGFEPYIVGGSVRDALLGKDSKDIDIEVYKATSEEVAASLKKIGKVDAVGESFGVLKITINEEDFDVSLPRRDSKTGDGHTGFEVEVDPDLSLSEATARRDYTINALMYSHSLGYIVDKHQGLDDLKSGYLRHVSDAFDEDPLRVLRGVQMASRFNMVMHPDTIEKANSLKDEYKDLATERVQIEFQKMWDKGQAPDKAFQLIYDTGWSQNFAGLSTLEDPETLKAELRAGQEISAREHLTSDKKQLLISALITQKMSYPDSEQFLEVTTVGSKAKNSALQLAHRTPVPSDINNASIRHFARDMPANTTLNDYVMLEESKGNITHAQEVREKALKANVLHQIEQDLINGDDLMGVFPDRKPGPWLRPAIEKLRDAQYNQSFATREGGLKWLNTHQNEL